MKIWKHKDTKATSIGCFSYLLLILAGTLIVLALIRDDSVPTYAWFIGILGLVISGLFMGLLWQSQKRVARYQKSRNERANAICDEVLTNSNPSTSYFVYLRPFNIDEKFVSAPRSEADQNYVEEYGLPTIYHDLESALALLVHPYGELVALSKKEGKAGAGYVKSTNDKWEHIVQKLCNYAEGIFIVPFDFKGTATEVEILKDSGFVNKTFFVMPAQSVTWRLFGLKLMTRNFRTLWEAGRTRYQKLGLELPEYDASGGIIQINEEVRILKVFGDKYTTNNRSKHDLKDLNSILQKLMSANKTS